MEWYGILAIVIGIILILSFIGLIYYAYKVKKVILDKLDKGIHILKIAIGVYLAIYVSDKLLAPTKLYEKLRNYIEENFDNVNVDELEVHKDPGYNAKTVLENEKCWFKESLMNMKKSVLEFITAPLSMGVRVMYTPIKMFSDLMTHERKVAAAFITDPSVSVDRDKLHKCVLQETNDKLEYYIKG